VQELREQGVLAVGAMSLTGLRLPEDRGFGKRRGWQNT
jgi:hypothetical protein